MLDTQNGGVLRLIRESVYCYLLLVVVNTFNHSKTVLQIAQTTGRCAQGMLRFAHEKQI